MSATSIEWTDRSVNPIRARRIGAGTKSGYNSGVGHFCEKVSSGCANCYSSTMQKRFGMPDFPGKSRALPVAQTDGSIRIGDVEVFFDESRLHEVLSRKKPTKWFWCDMTDMFGRWVPFEWIDKCFAVMALTPHHTHQVLTKRPERMAEYLKGDGEEAEDRISWAAAQMFKEQNAVTPYRRDVFEIGQDDEGKIDSIHLVNWPLPNCWLGTSCEDQQRADERIPHLLQCPAAKRFLSVEPMLGAIDLRSGIYLHKAGIDIGTTLCDISWVIVGGESGPGSRPFDIAWARSIRDQCQAAGVAFFLKQLGANVLWDGCQGGYGDETSNMWPAGTVKDAFGSNRGWRVLLKDSKGGDMEEWPEDIRIRQFPEMEAAR